MDNLVVSDLFDIYASCSFGLEVDSFDRVLIEYFIDIHIL